MKLDELDPDHFTRMGAYTKTIHRDVYPAVDPSSPALSQHGKVAIVTGTSSGFGAEGIAPAFAKAGARGLVLVARRGEKLHETAQGIRKQFPSTEILEAATDIADPKAVETLFESVKAKFGHADVLVNNAGVQTGPSPLSVSDEAKWWTDMEVNTRGTYLMTRMFLRALGEENTGTVINMSSGASNVTIPGMSSYSISKLAINRYAEYLEVENPNVTCVTLDPGTVNTTMVPEFLRKFARDTPSLIGGVCVWIATDAASFLKGRFIMANWDVDELVARKDEITGGNDLRMTLQGKFGITA